ncbi:thioredoxin-dependent thiol peroxidase [Membranihabitans maritimus]|uniref:thioredoxin-dependent thiol peroxidase n=1 Tax=Membranihabitans maritimus TaxID=2904244 RepID=UPI0034E24A0D
MTKLNTGEKAPDFSGIDQNGNNISLKDFQGKKLALFFYPKDNTPGCTKEVCNLRDNYSQLQNEGYEIIGVSADTEKSHKKFSDKFDLPFPLIADTEKKIINDYGIWGKKKFMGREYDGIHRKTFLIDENGMIEKIIEKVKTKDHAAQILA